MSTSGKYIKGLVGVLILFAAAGICHGEIDAQKQLEFADGLFHRGFHSEAIAEYEEYLSQVPAGADAITAWLRLGRSAVVIGQYEKALTAFQHAKEGAGSLEQRLEAQVSCGEALFFLNRYVEVIAALKSSAEGSAAPETRARALYYMGRAYLEADDSLTAITVLSTLISELPESTPAPFARYHLGFALIAAGDIEGASTAFSAAADTTDTDAVLRMESRFRAAELYDKLGWNAAALAAYERLRNEFPDSEYADRADYGYAWAMYNSGKYEEAQIVADTFLKQYAETSQAAGLEYLRGNCCYQQNKYEDALRIYGVLRKKYPGSSFAERALYKIAWSHHLMEATAEAQEAIRIFLEAYADSALRGEAAYLLGITCVAVGNYEEALTEFRRIATEYPDSKFSEDALFKAGECYAQLGLRNEAANTFEEFARRYPGNPLTEQAMLRSGDARFTAQDFAEALANYGRILEAPGDAHIEEETLYRMAVTYHNMKDYDESAAAFLRLLEKFPEGLHAVESQFRIGEYELHHHENPLKAVEAYQAVLNTAKENPFTVRTLQGLASARYEQKDYEQAAVQLLKILAEYPDSPLTEEAYVWCSQWLRDQERWKDAVILYESMVISLPDYAHRGGLLFILGECLEKSDESDRAIQVYNEALLLAQGTQRTAEIQYRLAMLHEGKGDAETAMVLFETVANLNGGDVSARARFHLAAVQESQGNHESAARNYMRLAILYAHETLSPEALWRAGNCYQTLGNRDQAASVYKELLADYPDSSFAEQAQDALHAMMKPVEAAE